MIVETIEEIDLYGKPAPIGTIVDRPDSYWLIGLGVAKPVDEEAQAKAQEFAEQKARVKAKLEKQAAERMEQQRVIEETTAKLEEQQRHAQFEAVLRGEIDEPA
jgi:hypothetical protein